MFNEPDRSYHGLVYARAFRTDSLYSRGVAAYFCEPLDRPCRPCSAFLLLQGVETVALRIERHVTNGRKVAEFLRADPRVDWVNYAGFPDNPYYVLAQKYLGGHACSLMTFGIRGGLEAGKASTMP